MLGLREDESEHKVRFVLAHRNGKLTHSGSETSEPFNSGSSSRDRSPVQSSYLNSRSNFGREYIPRVKKSKVDFFSWRLVTCHMVYNYILRILYEYIMLRRAPFCSVGVSVVNHVWRAAFLSACLPYAECVGEHSRLTRSSSFVY